MKDYYNKSISRTVQGLTWLLYGRNHKSPIKCDNLLTIPPDRIKYAPVNKPDLPLPLLSGVKAGTWDINLRLIEDDVVYKSFTSRFCDGEDWESTEYYDLMQKRIDDNSVGWRNFKSNGDIQKRLNSLDRLYEEISENGYTKQSELKESTNEVLFPVKNTGDYLLPPEFREISVYVNRNGEFLWSHGMHRLCMAKLLKLDQIPVRVSVRHIEWQKHRDKVWCQDSKSYNHPDLK